MVQGTSHRLSLHLSTAKTFLSFSLSLQAVELHVCWTSKARASAHHASTWIWSHDQSFLDTNNPLSEDQLLETQRKHVWKAWKAPFTSIAFSISRKIHVECKQDLGWSLWAVRIEHSKHCIAMTQSSWVFRSQSILGNLQLKSTELTQLHCFIKYLGIHNAKETKIVSWRRPWDVCSTALPSKASKGYRINME